MARFLKICLDYQIRGGKHYIIPKATEPFLVQCCYSKDIYDFGSQLNVPEYKKWPQVRVDKNGTAFQKQSKLVLLLIAGLNLNVNLTGDELNLANMILKKAWEAIRDKCLRETDQTNKGYRLDFFDEKTVNFQIMGKGWKCPVDNVAVDTLFRGYSPRMRGVISKENFARFKVNSESMKFPYFPYAKGKYVSNDGSKNPVTYDKVRNWVENNWLEQKKNGIVNDLTYRILFRQPIFMAENIQLSSNPRSWKNMKRTLIEGI